MSAEAAERPLLPVELRPLLHLLGRIRLRVRVLLWLRLATIGLGGAAALLATVLLVSKLLAIYYPTMALVQVGGLVLGLCLVLATAWPLPDETLAAATDRRAGLQDRLATALYLGRQSEPSPMAQAMLGDAFAHAVLLQPAQAFPLCPPRGWKPAMGALAALLAVQLLPLPALFLTPQMRHEKAELREQGRRLLPVAARLQHKARESKDPEAEKAARKLRRLAEELKLGKLDKKHALLKLNEVDKELAIVQRPDPKLGTAQRAAQRIAEQAKSKVAEQAESLADKAASKGDPRRAEQLRELSKSVAKAKDASEVEKLSSQIRDLASQLGEPVELPSRLAQALADALAGRDAQDLQEELESLQQALESGEQLSEEEREELAEQLQELADNLSDTELQELAEQLAEASKCMKQGDCEGAGRCLGQAAQGAGGACRLAAVSRAAGEAREGVGSCSGDLRGQSQCGATGAGVGPDDGSQTSIPANAPAAKLYAPRSTETSGTLQRVPAQMNPSGGPVTGTTTQGAPDVGSRSTVPYYEVMPEYSRVAEEALTKEEIPPAYRRTVREYFDALQSGAPEQAKAEE